MITALRSAAAAALFLAATPIMAVAAPAPAPTAALRADAVALAELVSPHDLFVAQVVQGARGALLGTGPANPDLMATEKLYPGVLEALWKAAEPEFRSYAEALLPAHRASLAGVYQARLTPAEIAAIHVFYSSPTGKKLVREIYTADLQPVISEVAAWSEADISAEAYAKAERIVIGDAAKAMTSDDAPALSLLTRTVSLAKMRDLGTEVRKVSLELINKPDPAFEARITKISEAVFERFMAEAPATQ